MANNTLKTRIVINNKTSSEWSSSASFVPLKGEICIYNDLDKAKIGDGTATIADLNFAWLTPAEVQQLISAASHSHSNKTILDSITAAFTTELKTKLDGIATGANKTVVDSAMSSTSTNPVQNKVVQAALDGKVPTSRTVNGKALSANITLSASDVGADASGSASNALASAKSYSDTNLATAKSYADTKVANLVGSAPETMDTLEEVAAAIAAHQDVTDALNAAIGNKVDKVSGKGLSTNDYTTAEKNKLSGIATGAEVNQNAFSNVVVGSTTVAADSKTDTLTLVAGSNVTITPDATNDKITIAAKDTTYSDMTGATTSAAGTHGLVPAPTSGTANRYLRSDGTWSVPPDNNTTYSTFGAATSSAAGTSGLVPAPAAGKQGQYLRGDGTWATPTNTTYGAAGDSLGLVKTGGDVTIASGVITVNDDSHNHVISNVDGLQAALDGKAAKSHGTHVTYSTTAPAAPGTASVGTATTVSRSDHVHPLQTSVSGSSGSCTGNSATATKLANARTIAISGGAVGTATSFDGSGNITIPVTSVNALKLTIGSSDTLILDGSI